MIENCWRAWAAVLASSSLFFVEPTVFVGPPIAPFLAYPVWLCRFGLLKEFMFEALAKKDDAWLLCRFVGPLYWLAPGIKSDALVSLVCWAPSAAYYWFRLV